jgi:hypothetical protein
MLSSLKVPLPHPDVSKQFEFTGSYTIKYASLILGVLEIEGDYFLLYVEDVYLQSPLPPDQTSLYQIASIGFMEYARVVSNRQRDIFDTLRTVFPLPLRRYSTSASTSPSVVT